MRRTRDRSLVVIALAALLSGAGLSCSAEDSHDPAPAPRVEWSEVSRIKIRAGSLDTAAPAAVREYRDALARYWGLEPNADRARLAAKLAAARGINAVQAAAWRELFDASAGRLVVSWDAERGTPTFVEVGIVLQAPDGASARERYATELGTAVHRMLGLGHRDTVVVDAEEQFTVDDGVGGADKTDVIRVRYRRQHDGLPVFGDWYDVMLRSVGHRRDHWQAVVTARWTRELNATTRPGIGSAAATSAVLGDTPGSIVRDAPVLGIDAGDTGSELVYRMFVADAEGGAWLYHVAAADGAIRQRVSQANHYDGTLNARVARPYEATKTPHPLPHATIYEDYRYYTNNPASCWTSSADVVNQWTGDESKILGQTSYGGSYAGLVPIEAGDASWTVDYSGPYVKDVSEYAILDLSNFPAGTSHTFPQQTSYARSRRGEIFYLLNYGRRIYSTTAYGLPQYEPLAFWYRELTVPNDCQVPEGFSYCCNGKAEWAGCFEMWCGSDIAATAHPGVERMFRVVALHEQNHTLRRRVSETMCSFGDCGTTAYDRNECGCFEEGRAMFAALALTQFEATHEAYRPGRLYPNELDGDKYWSGSIWTALYSHYLLKSGVGPALKDIHYNLASVDSSTRMVGSCVDSDGDGYVEISECPVNSYMRQVLSANLLWDGRYRRQAEISEVFHFHVTDASRTVAGVQSFPWADEMPNHRGQPAFVAAESGTTDVVEGIGSGSGPLRFDDAADHDTVMFLARAGETYSISTQALSTGMDTYIEVLDRTGLETVLASNDDCGASPASCVTFSPSVGGYYRVRAHPITGSAVGPSSMYTLRITLLNDDHGDGAAEATPLVADGGARSASFESAGDVDVFKVVSSEAQTLQYRVCSTGAGPVVAELLGPSGIVIDSHTGGTCGGGGAWAFAIGSGVHFIRTYSSTGMTGGYEVSANPLADIDRDSTALNAWTLQDDAMQGRLLATRFESAGDEDWYRFSSTTAGRFFVIESWGLDAAVDTEIEVYAPSSTVFGRVGPNETISDDTSGGNALGHWMLKDDDGAIAPRGSRLAFMTPLPGTYYVRVRNKSASSGSYRVAFHDTGLNSGWYPYP